METTPGQADARAYAQWPGGPQDSSIALRRAVRSVRTFDRGGGGAGGGGGPQAAGPKEQDRQQFLASLSEAFAPELLDLRVGLLRGADEIVPLGIATVVVPGEYGRMRLDIPVVRDHGAGGVAPRPAHKSKIAQLRKRSKASRECVSFAADKDTKYKLDEGAFLRLELSIEPAATAPAAAPPPRHRNADARKTDFKAGPLNRALRRRRKMDHLLSLERLPLHRRLQLYLELRSRRARDGHGASPASQEICTGRQTDVSDLSFDLPPLSAQDTSEAEDPSVDWAMDRFDALASSAGSEKNSILVPVSEAEPDANTQEAPTPPFPPQAPPLSPASMTAPGAARQDGTATLASEPAGASVQRARQTEVGPTSMSVSVAQEQEGRLSPLSQDSHHGETLTNYSSSLYSVLTTNHPQKPTVVQRLLGLLECERNGLILCEGEKNVLQYYAQEQEDKIAQYFAPYFQEDFSLQDTCADEDTLASFESASVLRRRKR